MQKEDPRTTVGKKLEELSDYGSEDEDEDFVAEDVDEEAKNAANGKGKKAKEQGPRRMRGMGGMAGAGAEVVAAENVPMTATEARRAKKIDSLWSELQAESTAAFGVGPSGKSAGKGVKKKKTKKPKAQAAAKGLGEGTDGGAGVASASAPGARKPAGGAAGPKQGGAAKAKKKGKAKRAKGSALEFQMPDLAPRKRRRQGALQRTVAVKERVRFAGKEMELERQVAAGSKEAASYAAKQAEEESWQSGARSGESVLNRIMAKMRGDRAVSTVEKSAYDWEGYKDEHGVKKEVEEFAKDGYVARQEFLQRVDAREFEQEKEQRARERAARAAQQ